MKPSVKALLVSTCMTLSSVSFGAETLTIATVNNSDMIRMQKLSKTFEAEHPDIKLNWVVLEENVLRQRLTTDIATQGGQFDVLTIGMYEAALWGAKGWLEPMKDLPASYDLDDVFPSVRDGLSVKGSLYALPFYAESSITYYRTDLFKNAGLTMPEHPTWTQIGEFAEKLTDKSKEQYGLCLRGKAGWGENMALITTLANGFGARWFDEKWQPQFNGPEWKDALNFYVDNMKKSGPPGASSNGFNENLALFNSGKCAIWVDASVAGSFVTDKTQSKVADHVGFTFAPHEKNRQGHLVDVLLVPGHPGQFQSQGRRQGLYHLGNVQGIQPIGRQDRRHCQRTTRHPHLDLQRRVHEGRAVCQGDPGIVESRRPESPYPQARALHRHPVGDHSRIPGHRHPSGQVLFGRADRPADRGPGVDRRAVHHRTRDETRWVSQVVNSLRPAPGSCGSELARDEGLPATITGD